MRKPRAYSYLRFSTPEQQRGDSFRRQKELAERYAAVEGLELDDRSFQDLGVSAFRGKNASSGMLRTFLEAVESGAVPPGSFLLVESLDRLSRSTVRKALRQLEEICEAGVIVVTLADGKRYDLEALDRDPASLMMALIIMMRAHEESAMKSGRLKAAWKAKRSRAKEKPVTARTPAWVRVGTGGLLELIEERADVVRRIFELTLRGTGQHAIAALFNREGIPTFGAARYWQRSYIAKIIRNPAVAGIFVPHTVEYEDGKRRRTPSERVDGYFPAVISLESFEQAQAQFRGGTATRSESAIRNLFGGLARCPKCTATMTRVSKGPKGGKPYLVCVTAKQGAGCTYRAVPLEPLEEALIAHLPDIAREVPQPRTVAASELSATDAMLAQLDAKIAKIDPKDTLKLATYANMRANLLAERREEAARADAASGPAVFPRMKELVAEARREELDRPRINALMRQLYREVIIEYDMNMLALQWHHGGETAIVLST